MAGTTTPAAAPTYSDAYQKLVNDDGDIEGAIAYALYKRDKLAYAKSWKPGDPPLADYHKNALGPQAIHSARLAAQNLLSEYTSQAVAATQAAEQAKYVAGVGALQTLIVNATKFRAVFWPGVASGLAASLIFALVLALAIFLNKNEQNPLGAIYKQLNEGTEAASPLKRPEGKKEGT